MNRAHSRVLALFVLAAVPLAAGAPAPSPRDPEAEIRRLAGQVAEIAGKQEGLLDRMDLLKRRLRLDNMMLTRIKTRMAEAESAVAASTSRLNELAEKERETTRYLRGRMRQCYALGVLQEYRVIFAVGSTQDLRTAGYYLSALSQRDLVAFKEISAVRAEQARVQRELASARDELALRAADTESEQASLTQEMADMQGALDRLGRARESAQQGLEETLAAARAMDRYVQDMAFRKRVDTAGKSMVSARGRLEPPCAGTVLRGFGEYVHPRFKTRIPHPGLDISAPLGAPVAAVFDGEVEYAGWLSGYGYTVIVSHQGGYFSIYGHLDQAAVAKGEAVSQGQVLGAVGEDPALDTTDLYFELRQGSKALDPAAWLRAYP